MGKSGARSQSGVETLSRVSRGRLTSKSGRSGYSRGSRGSRRSGKSGYTEEDYEEMSVEEIDVLLEKAQREVDIKVMEKRKINSNKLWTDNTKKKKKVVIDTEINILREKIRKLDIIRDSKIPFYEKIPKDSPFYKHYISVLYQARLVEATSKKVLEDRSMFANAASLIPAP